MLKRGAVRRLTNSAAKVVALTVRAEAGGGSPAATARPVAATVSIVQFTVITTELLRPSGASVAPASDLFTILMWFGTLTAPTAASGSRLNVMRYWPVFDGTPVTCVMKKFLP